jgi:hypothetical protein
VGGMADAREEELLRLAEAKGVAVSVKRSKSLGRQIIEISVGDPATDGRDAQTFHTFENATEYLAGK